MKNKNMIAVLFGFIFSFSLIYIFNLYCQYQLKGRTSKHPGIQVPLSSNLKDYVTSDSVFKNLLARQTSKYRDIDELEGLDTSQAWPTVKKGQPYRSIVKLMYNLHLINQDGE